MDELINILAKRYNKSPELIEKIIRSEFKFVLDTMEEGELESVHLHHLGKFAIKPRYCKIEEHGND